MRLHNRQRLPGRWAAHKWSPAGQRNRGFDYDLPAQRFRLDTIASRTTRRAFLPSPLFDCNYEPPLRLSAKKRHLENRHAVRERIEARQRVLESQDLSPSEVRHQLAKDVLEILKESGFDASGYRAKDDSLHGYGKYLLYSGATGDQPFAIQIFAFDPEQETPVHDHPCECRSLIWEGEVNERHFTREGEDEAAPRTERQREAGDSALLVPNRPNIHSIVNPSSTERAVTVHFYFMDGIEQAAAVDGVYQFAGPAALDVVA